MNDLAKSLKVVLADTFKMYMLTHKYHLNVEGGDFYQYHKLFETIYDELWQSVDAIAEHIRALDEYVPFSFGRFDELSSVEDDVKIPTASVMMERLLSTNDVVLASLRAAVEQAKLANDEGVINFLGGRLEAHTKHGWFLRATTKKSRE
jgi:starvation-inducible DNA-binding protein